MVTDITFLPLVDYEKTPPAYTVKGDVGWNRAFHLAPELIYVAPGSQVQPYIEPPSVGCT